jgi:DNA polymerase III alpha subunit
MDMYPIEDMGLVKIDLLGQRSLAVISDVEVAVESNYGIKLDWDKIEPTEDIETKRIMREGQTMGCFYVESPGMRNLLQKLRVDDFETLVAASSIIRPGVSDSGMMAAYINRSLGREEVSYLCPQMEDALGPTHGVMIYQEDVLKVANAVAGMGLGEADALRRCMSKKRNWERMDKYRERFIHGAIERGVVKEVAREIWRQIESFGGYAFCKAHSASFAVVSYQTAYLKAHFPAEFLAAVMANRGGFYNTAAYIEEARRLGIAIMGPDVEFSDEQCQAEPEATGSQGLKRF